MLLKIKQGKIFLCSFFVIEVRSSFSMLKIIENQHLFFILECILSTYSLECCRAAVFGGILDHKVKPEDFTLNYFFFFFNFFLP
jgi:hypothetical protein